MTFQPGVGQPMISDEFNRMCTEARVEGRVQHLPNPGNPMSAMKLVTFTNFNDGPVTVTEQPSGKKHVIQPRGTLQIMLKDKYLPLVEKGTPNDHV